jgi:hypothetical protein
LCQSCGWILPCEKICFASERHSVCRVDDRGLIHCEDGPAVAYPDGFEVYGWHGTRIPAEWIKDKANLTPAVVLAEKDGNKRAAAIQIIGWGKLRGALGGKTIDRHPEGMIGGELDAVPKGNVIPGQRGTMKLLYAECPRNGTIAFRVPDEITIAHAAQAWAAGLPADIYQLPATRT